MSQKKATDSLNECGYNTLHHNFSHIVIIILSSSWAQRSFTLSFSKRKTSNVQLIYSAAVKIRCCRTKPTRKQVRLYCKFVLYCELLSNSCIRVKIYHQKQLVAQNFDFFGDHARYFAKFSHLYILYSFKKYSTVLKVSLVFLCRDMSRTEINLKAWAIHHRAFLNGFLIYCCFLLRWA